MESTREARWPEPVEPPPSPWILPDPNDADRVGLVGVGADLAPGTLLAAYRAGLFPMPVGEGEATAMGWWSPERRAILPLDGVIVSRSLHKARKRFEIRVNTAFAQVVQACADPRRPGSWITSAITEAYAELHRLGWAHSVEAWSVDTGELAGGLYGVGIGGLFAGESMFHWRTDASKAALVSLVERMEVGGGLLLDCQWLTRHLASLGAIEIRRADYLAWLAKAIALPNLRLR
ncbi:MAG TPA: leucyl/phenylalanyl-tRNA--protein transferase [Acidimicrobiales bacterium]|nr:leucyl/phenylalanyl-tRNA--protein transferase [Acidimicrobiales bacterium]